MASAPPTERPCEIHDARAHARFRSGTAVTVRAARAARAADVVYASATYAAAAVAASVPAGRSS